MLQRDNIHSGPQRLVFRDKDRMWLYLPLLLIGAILGFLSIGQSDMHGSDANKIVNGYSVASILFFLVGLHIATVRKIVFDKSLGQLEITSRLLFFRSSKEFALGPMRQVAINYSGDSDWECFRVVLRGVLEECQLVEGRDSGEITDFAQQVAQFLGLELMTWEKELFQRKEESGTPLPPGVRIIDRIDQRRGWESLIDKCGRLVFYRTFGTNIRRIGSLMVLFSSLCLLSVVFGAIQANPSAMLVVPIVIVFLLVGFLLWCGWQKIVFDKAKAEVQFRYGVSLPLFRLSRATGLLSEVVLAWRPVASGNQTCLHGEIVLRGEEGRSLSIGESPRGDEQRSMAERISKYLDWPMVEENRVTA